MNRVQHQTKKKKVFVDNKNSAFSQRGTDDASESSSNNTTNAPSEQQHQQKQKKPMAFKKVNNNAPSSSTSISSNISSSENVSNSATNKFSCCICCEEASVRTIFQTCNHSDVCHKCTLKLRVLNNDNRCCVCKNASECVIFSQRQNIKPFSEYTKDDLVYDETWKVYTDDYLLMNDITSLRRIECRLCKDSGVTLTFENSNVLNNHMNEVHKLNYCSYCLASRKVFLCEQKLYNWSNLMKHIKFGEEDPNYGKIEGHPLCKFCNVRFYSDDEIFDHMYKRHERCFICQKHGVQFEFYQDYKHLERHFDQKHFLCPHSECREEGFKVYENELELMAHKNRYHSSATSTSKKSKTQKLDLSTLSTTTHLPTDDERRQVRTGEINSSIIRFVDTAGDGYHNDNIHNKQPGQSSSGNKKQKQKKEKEASSDFKEKNNQLVKKMKELLTENQFQDLKVLSSQFLRGDTLASEYYSRVISMLGEEKTKEVFDLMVEAIPPQDENKKKALLLARNTYHSAEFNPNLGKEDANASSPQSSSNGTTPQNWPTLNNGNNNKSKSSDPNWNPQNPQPTPNQQPKKKKGPTLAHNVTRAPDLLWGVQNSTAPAGLNKEMEFPTLPTTPTPSSSKNAKKTNSNWTKPLKEEKQNSNNPYSEFGNIKVYKFSETKKKKNK